MSIIFKIDNSSIKFDIYNSVENIYIRQPKNVDHTKNYSRHKLEIPRYILPTLCCLRLNHFQIYLNQILKKDSFLALEKLSFLFENLSYRTIRILLSACFNDIKVCYKKDHRIREKILITVAQDSFRKIRIRFSFRTR